MTVTMDRPALGSPKDAAELLDMYYLNMRSALLETAAGLDRIEGAAGGEQVMGDQRVQILKKACRIIGGEQAHRAEQVLRLLSVE